MNFSTISTTWALLEKTAKILILAEPERLSIAKRIKADNLFYVEEVKIIDISIDSSYEQEICLLTEKDLLIVLLTMDGFMNKGFRNKFSPFSKPSGFAGKYIFIRLDIPEASLLSGLNTSIEKVESIISEYQALSSGKKVRVTTDKGTDVTIQIAYQELLPYHARSLGGNAFLPPAEISEELVNFSANGVIVVDITVGELRFGADLIDPLGIVDRNVKITLQNGHVVDIEGGNIARRLKTGLNKLGKDLQILVELGHGLSDITPTGIIGVDESMNGTCHFGIGNRNPYHVDVVVSNPKITVIEK
jgi:hypothetical protein